MDFEDLKESMKADIENQLPKQAVFNNHLIYLKSLVDKGYKLPVLNEKLDLGISTIHFQSLYRKALAKSKLSPATELAKPSIKPALKLEGLKEKPALQSLTSSSEWQEIFHDMSPHLINDIVKLGYNSNDVKEWVKTHSLISSTQLRKHVNRLKSS